MNLANMDMAKKRAEALKNFLHELTWEMGELVDFIVDRRVTSQKIQESAKSGNRIELLRFVSQCLLGKELMTIPLCVEIADNFDRRHRDFYVETLNEGEREELRQCNGKPATAPASAGSPPPAQKPAAAPSPKPPVPPSSPPTPKPEGGAMRAPTDSNDIRKLRGDALKAAAAAKDIGWMEVARRAYPRDQKAATKFMANLSKCSLGKALLFDEWAETAAQVLEVGIGTLTVRALTDEERRRFKVDARARRLTGGKPARVTAAGTRPARQPRGGRKQPVGRKGSNDMEGMSLDVNLRLSPEEISELLNTEGVTTTAEVRGNMIHLEISADVTLKQLFAMKAEDN